MSKNKWLLLLIVTSVITSLAIIVLIPYLVMILIMSQHPINMWTYMKESSTDRDRAVSTSTDILYASLAYDIDDSPLILKLVIPEKTYWSLSCYEDNLDCFYVLNDRNIESKQIQILLSKTGERSGESVAVKSSSGRGMILVRSIVNNNLENIICAYSQYSAMKEIYK